MKKINEKGRSMIEVMGYMGVVIAVVTGVGHLVSNSFDSYKYSKAYIQLTDLAGSIVKASAVDVDYTDVISMVNDNSNAEGKKIVPASFGRSANGFVHAFGGKVTVSPAPSDDHIVYSSDQEDNTPPSDKFAITFEGLSRKQCIEMALKDWENNHNIDLYAIIINSSNYWFWPIYTIGSDDSYTLPVKRSALTGTGQCQLAHTDDAGDVYSGDCGQCNQAGNNNSIMWIFN